MKRAADLVAGNRFRTRHGLWTVTSTGTTVTGSVSLLARFDRETRDEWFILHPDHMVACEPYSHSWRHGVDGDPWCSRCGTDRLDGPCVR